MSLTRSATKEKTQQCDIAVVGAGMHSLTLVLHLLKKRPKWRKRIKVFDPHGQWLTCWHHQFAAQAIPHLRSPAVHHPHPDPFALRRFAEKRAQELFPPYDLPGTKLFADFCQAAIAEFKIEEQIVSAAVTDLEPPTGNQRKFTLNLKHGDPWQARRVVLATNRTQRQLPDWLETIETPYPADRLCHSDQVDLRGLYLRGERIIVVGGGLSTGHLALGAIARHGKVTVIARRAFQEKLFDADAGWMGPKYLKGFHAEPDWEKRLGMVLNARDGGSLTPTVMRKLRQAARQGAVTLKPDCQIATAQWRGDHWQLYCDNGEIIEGDRLWLATGSRFHLDAEPLLGKIQEHYPQKSIQGFPLLDQYLRWQGCDLFLMGGLAALQVGPTARNISGARMACDHLVPALTKSSLQRVYGGVGCNRVSA
ncbi:FAD/NAD(P)-binding protein [[Limnothrix rosea] IAM M-220]|uniref:FAD/NAD(P)-binding protein n=1 Tax=[Limnothrix rosea] IAM M-220 TaxID=454133 RepID=UPI000962F899|nr:FAD/NAD(P)-binding protein [[Limnothrix rosea] IAM M-220]OKH15102.1 FAD-dependent oxidoreductase [[Limnothrix rosea] IAM M-220]